MLAVLLTFVLLADGEPILTYKIMPVEQCIAERDLRFKTIDPLIKSGEVHTAAFKCEKFEGATA